MGALLDLVKVLYEPEAVFTRVREKPSFLMPFIGLSVVQLVLSAVNLPFMQAAMRAQQAAGPAGAPDTSKFAVVGLAFVPVGLVIVFLIAAFVLWVLVSIMGGEAKFKTLLSMTAYASVPGIVLLGIVGVLVLRMKGLDTITSTADLQPAIGLDLVMPGVTGFLGGVLKGINPFSIWGLVLTAIGVSTTHNQSKGTGYSVATVSFVLSLLIAGAVGTLGGGPR